MTEYVTVSAKIDRKLRERLAELGIKPSAVIKKALEEEVERKTLELLRMEVEKASKILSRLTEEEIIESIRESRDAG
ncbi:MAG: hypothetical protein QW231_07015 [Candidatus Bathyarchaeia archaeon]